MRKVAIMLPLFCLCLLRAYADGEQVCVITNIGSAGKACTTNELNNQLGRLPNPCEELLFGIEYASVPSGYQIAAKYEWFVNDVLSKTTTTVSDKGFIYKLTSQKVNVYCKVYYKNTSTGAVSTAYHSNTFTVNVNSYTFNPISGPTTIAFGCQNPVSYSQTPTSTGTLLNPPPPNSYTIAWQAPSDWVQTSLTNNGQNVSFTPSTTTGGTLTATATFPACGYKQTQTLSISRNSYIAPTFASTNPNLVCGSSANFGINPACGATSYTYTLVGNATFTSNGQTTLTTTSTSANITFPTGSYQNTLKVKANYSNSSSSAEISTQIGHGAPSFTGYYTIISDYHSQPTYQYPLGPNNSYFLPANKTSQVDVYIQNADISSISWTNSGPYYPNWSPVNNGKRLTIAVTAGPTSYESRTANFMGTSTNSCGTSTNTIAITVVTQGYSTYSVVASPNPAKKNLTVKLEKEFKEIEQIDKEEKVIIDLYDFNTGALIKKWQFINNQQQFNLDIGDVKTGKYILSVNKGKFKESTQVFVTQ